MTLFQFFCLCSIFDVKNSQRYNFFQAHVAAVGNSNYCMIGHKIWTKNRTKVYIEHQKWQVNE